MNKVETKQCDKCEGIKYHNMGIGKTSGRPYENWKCNKCGDTEWVSQKPKNSPNQANYSPSKEEYTNLIARLSKLELLIKAFAIRSGVSLSELEDEYKRLQEVVN